MGERKMRKIITLGIMLLFLGMTISSSTGFNLEKQSTIATFEGPINKTILTINGAELEIEIVTGLYTGAIIKNIGDEDAYNVNWSISVKGGMLNLVSVSGEGTINVLPHSDLIGTAVRLRQPTLGFGLVEITATAIGENAELVIEKIYGLLLLFWIIQLS
jgi:hypothetical protein